MSPSHLAKGNFAFRNKDFEQAIHHYKAAEAVNPELSRLIRSNIELARRRAGNKQVCKQRQATIDIVVPVFNALEDVKKCLASLEQCTDQLQVHVIVVNDGSDAPTTAWLRSFCCDKPIFLLIEHPTNTGYTRAVNTGLRASTAAYVITQNSDTIVAPGWLEGLIRCMQSSPTIGIVGPLSNAASWQSVPRLYDDQGAFAVNDLPAGYSAADMARSVARASVKAYPRLPFVNGFCFMIKREVIDSVGYMDEETFPIGYGEENDYCIRAMDAGFDLAIADDVYVYHAKSKSFGHERRKELSQQGTRNLKQKHSLEKYTARVDLVKKTDKLDAVRSRIQKVLAAAASPSSVIDLMRMRVLFLLPVKGGGGGAHSVVQEVAEMRRMGLSAHIGVKHGQVSGFLKNYEDILNAAALFVGFDDDSILDIAEDYDVVVGTVFTSMKLVERVVQANPGILPAYYVQDYEPMFFAEGSANWQEAFDSYALVPNAFLFAKTQWIIDEVERHHGVKVHKVSPSIDHEIYRPAARPADGLIRLTAMIRPQTPRRGAKRTMRVLSRLHKAFPGQLAIQLFGCAEESEEFKSLQRDFSYQQFGELKRPQVATLLSQSDLFIDLSDYQAFGRTALEAMACACASVVPLHGGANEYAVTGENTLVVNSLNEDECFEAIASLMASPAELKRLQHAGLRTAARYSVHSAAVSECVSMAEALSAHRVLFGSGTKPTLVLIPSRRTDGIPAGSGYVRIVVPYTMPAIRKHWRVCVSDTLPAPGSADAVVIQRDAAAFDLDELKVWHSAWKATGKAVLYEIDDDLLDGESLRSRGFKGDVQTLINKVRFLAKTADLVTVSTQPLAKIIRQINPNVRVIPNALDVRHWQLNNSSERNVPRLDLIPNRPIRIGYIGTPTHDADLDLIAPAMQAIQKKYGARVEIEVIGGFQHKTPSFGKRVALPKKTDYPNFVHWLLQRAQWDVGVIPLKGDDFNKSKSNLKFLEYSALKLAIVCSDVPTYADVASNLKNSLVVSNTTEQWIAALEQLIESETLRQRLSNAAHEDVQRRHTLNGISAFILETLSKVAPGLGTVDSGFGTVHLERSRANYSYA